MYQFLANMWIMRKVDEQYLYAMVDKGYITQEEKDMIIAIPQVPKA